MVTCNKDDDNISPNEIIYKQEMREFVIGISQYSKSINSNFLIIPQNGIELVTNNGEDDGNPQVAYLNAIDGNGQEDLFFGYDNDDQATPGNENSYLKTFLDISKDAGKQVLVTDYCSTHSNMDNSYIQNNSKAYVSFAADHRELDNIPAYPSTVYEDNNKNINSLSGIKKLM